MIIATAHVIMRLVLLHAVDGHEIAINPDQVTNLVASVPDTKNKLMAEAIRCRIELSSGKFIGVIEPCDVVKQLLESAK